MRLPTLKLFSGTLDPAEVIVGLIQYALIFIGAIALIFVIYGGIIYITSGGDAEKTTKARNTLMYAVLGIIIVVLSYAIVTWASSWAAGGLST